MEITLDDGILELINDHTYTPFSADNPFPYEHVHMADDYVDRGFQLISSMGIKIRNKWNPEEILHSAIVCETGLPTDIGEQACLVQNNQLLLCICDMVYCLDLHSLALNWKTRTDEATCFTIHPFGEGLITHGELQLTFLDLTGAIQWQFSARDIFVTFEGHSDFRIENDLAMVKDWTGYQYFLDVSGKVVKEVKPKDNE